MDTDTSMALPFTTTTLNSPHQPKVWLEVEYTDPSPVASTKTTITKINTVYTFVSTYSFHTSGAFRFHGTSINHHQPKRPSTTYGVVEFLTSSEEEYSTQAMVQGYERIKSNKK